MMEDDFSPLVNANQNSPRFVAEESSHVHSSLYMKSNVKDDVEQKSHHVLPSFIYPSFQAIQIPSSSLVNLKRKKFNRSNKQYKKEKCRLSNLKIQEKISAQPNSYNQLSDLMQNIKSQNSSIKLSRIPQRHDSSSHLVEHKIDDIKDWLCLSHSKS